MHARVLTIDLRPEELEEAVHIYHAVVVPAMEAHPGFRGLLLLTDRETGAVRSITLWDRAEDFLDDVAYRDVLGAFTDRITIRTFKRESFEVSARL